MMVAYPDLKRIEKVVVEGTLIGKIEAMDAVLVTNKEEYRKVVPVSIITMIPKIVGQYPIIVSTKVSLPEINQLVIILGVHYEYPVRVPSSRTMYVFATTRIVRAYSYDIVKAMQPKLLDTQNYFVYLIANPAVMAEIARRLIREKYAIELPPFWHPDAYSVRDPEPPWLNHSTGDSVQDEDYDQLYIGRDSILYWLRKGRGQDNKRAEQGVRR